RVDLLIQYLVQDEPDLGGWQSGLLTARGAVKPSYHAFQVPLSVERRSLLAVTLWGQVRPGSGREEYVLEARRSGHWTPVGSPSRTGPRGVFVRSVAAPGGTRFRVVLLGRGLTSATVAS